MAGPSPVPNDAISYSSKDENSGFGRLSDEIGWYPEEGQYTNAYLEIKIPDDVAVTSVFERIVIGGGQTMDGTIGFVKSVRIDIGMDGDFKTEIPVC